MVNAFLAEPFRQAVILHRRRRKQPDDRAKGFYEKLGFRLDVDYAAPMTTTGQYSALLGGFDHLRQGDHLRPAGLDRPPGLSGARHRRTRKELIAQGVEVSEVFHDAGGSRQQFTTGFPR